MSAITRARADERLSWADEVNVATVDVVIAAKNEERYIGDCLAALAAQRYDPRLVNVFVADNGSTDRTRAICAKKGVRVLSCPGATVSACRNIGTRAGTGALVAFLDAHCLAPSNWLSAMVAAFKLPQIGGCQGGLLYHCTDPWTEKICRHSILNDKRFFRDCTIHSRGAAYPWIASGNAMYRRQAIEQVDLYDEKLPIGEDVDLSWRVVLAGYQLVYAENADVTHYYSGSPIQFARRYFMYGIGGARVDRKFGLHGRVIKPEKGDALACKTLWGEGLDSIRFLGRWWETLRMAMKLATVPALYEPQAVVADVRKSFHWDANVRLRLSSSAIYWPEANSGFCVITLDSRQRIVFRDTAATIFSCLLEGMNRNETLLSLSQEYEATSSELSETLDDFVLQLIEEHIYEVTV